MEEKTRTPPGMWFRYSKNGFDGNPIHLSLWKSSEIWVLLIHPPITQRGARARRGDSKDMLGMVLVWKLGKLPPWVPTKTQTAKKAPMTFGPNGGTLWDNGKPVLGPDTRKREGLSHLGKKRAVRKKFPRSALCVFRGMILGPPWSRHCGVSRFGAKTLFIGSLRTCRQKCLRWVGPLWAG